jgi:hypothetical protein
MRRAKREGLSTKVIAAQLTRRYAHARRRRYLGAKVRCGTCSHGKESKWVEVTDDFWRNNLGKPVDQSLLTPERPDAVPPNEGLSRTGTALPRHHRRLRGPAACHTSPRVVPRPYPERNRTVAVPTPYRKRMPGVPKHQAQLLSGLAKNPPTRRFQTGLRPAETTGRSAPARIGCTTGPGSTA